MEHASLKSGGSVPLLMLLLFASAAAGGLLVDEVAPGSVCAVSGDPVLLAELRFVLVDLRGLSQLSEVKGGLQEVTRFKNNVVENIAYERCTSQCNT